MTDLFRYWPWGLDELAFECFPQYIFLDRFLCIYYLFYSELVLFVIVQVPFDCRLYLFWLLIRPETIDSSLDYLMLLWLLIRPETIVDSSLDLLILFWLLIRPETIVDSSLDCLILFWLLIRP